MSLRYHVYKNDFLGGPIDTGTIYLDVTTLTANVTIPPSSDASFLVRAYDTVSGLEDRNTEARARIVTDAAGVDVTRRANPPTRLTARPRQGGALGVSWLYNPANQGAPPTSFKVWVTLGTVPNTAVAPTVAVPFDPRRPTYAVVVPGLTDGATYAVAVRSTNAYGDETNTRFVLVIADGAGPSPVDDLAGAATAAA